MERAPEPPAADVWRSAAANDARTVDALLSRCAWIDVDAGNELGETLLHVAAARGHDETVRVLLRHRASLTSRDRESGWTPLHRSVYNQHMTTSLLLLRHAQVHHGRKFMRAYLHGTLDFEQQSAMDLISRRSADALEVEAATTADKDTLRGGMVYTFGKRDYQLGYHLPNADVQSTPRLVELSFASPIRQISASKYHTIALNDAGECFVWGFGKGGRLGTGTEFDHVEPTRIPSLLDIPIAKVAAGENHSLALSRSGQVFSWGSNSFGQLGHNAKTLTHQARLTPKRIDAFKGLVMVEIAASGCHSAAISCEADGGIVYTWGSNKKGQLGRKEGAGTDQPYPTPRPVDALVLNHPLSAIYEDYDAVCATQLALSDWHSCVILRCWRNGKSHGQVWQFGYGSNYPTRINFKDGKRRTGSVLLSDTWIPTWAHRVTDIVQISCAQNHSIALASSGCVYTWGLNESALSHTTTGKNMRQRGDDSTGIPGAPQSVDLTKYGPIASICASQDHCAVVTRAGDLVTWGGGAQGVLGHGRENTWQPNPKRVPGVKKAVAVATGHQHTVVLVAPHLPDFPYTRSSEESAPVQTLMSLSGILQERLAQWLDISNCATILKYAEDYDARQLQEYCLDYMGRNWDAFLDLMCKERLETLFDMFLPPSEPMELEQKSKTLASTLATTPARSPKPVVTFEGLEALDAFTLGGKMPVKPMERKKSEMKASGSKRECHVEQTSTGSATPLSSAAKSPKLASFPDPATAMPSALLTSSAKRKSGKFVPLDHFLSSSKPSTDTELVSPADLPSAIDRAGGLTSPWGLTRSGPALPVTSPQLQKSVRKGSLDLANALVPPPRPRKESIGAHPSASPLLSYGQSPLLTSATSGTSSKNVLGADGIERPQIAAFSLDAFIKKPSRNSRKGRRGMEVEKEEPKPALSWSGVAAGTSPVSPSFTPIMPPSTPPTSSQFKTLKEIQEEEEARVAAEAAAKARLGTYSRRNASTVNSWGLCEAQGHISLAEVQKLQEEQAFIEEQRQILAQIEREREAMSKSSSQKSQKKLKGAVRPENHAQKDEERVKKGKKANAKDAQDSASASGKKSSKPRNSSKSSKPRDESGASAPKTDKAVSSVEGSAEKRRRKKKSLTEQDATPHQPTEKKKRPEKKSKRPAKTSEPALQPSVVAA